MFTPLLDSSVVDVRIDAFKLWLERYGLACYEGDASEIVRTRDACVELYGVVANIAFPTGRTNQEKEGE